MDARQIKLAHFIAQTDVQFIIPVYQRNYDWGEKQCADFIHSLESLISTPSETAISTKKTHFLGTIVYVATNSYHALEQEIHEYLLIDGQQRLTTTLLFLKAMYDVLEDEYDRDEIYDLLYIKRKKQLRLVLNKADNLAFEALFRGDIDPNHTSKIYKNYLFFIHYFKQAQVPPIHYFKIFKMRLLIVYIELDREHDNPQLIFESINSTGLSLSQSDLIRNFILMDKTNTEQRHLFDHYWEKIEKKLPNELITAYIRDYLTMKENEIPTQKNVYNIFKRYVREHALDAEDLLRDLLYYASFYAQFVEPFQDKNAMNASIQAVLQEIKELKVTVSYPFLLALFNDHAHQILSQEDLVRCLQLIKNYVFRRHLCDYATGSLNSFFSTLYKELSAIPDYSTRYHDALVTLLTQKRTSMAFPSDEEFKKYFLSKEIYKLNTKKYILYQMESFQNKESVPSDDLTIEHIMPQSLTPRWAVELDDKSGQVHEHYLHTIGNLTLTGYNSELSNKDFQEKKRNLAQSGVRLNRYFERIDHWNKEAIEERAIYLFQAFALKIWPYPTIEHPLPDRDIPPFYNLSANINPTGYQIYKIVVLQTEIKVASWGNAFFEFSRFLYQKESDRFYQLTTDPDFQGRLRRIIDSVPDSMRKPYQLMEQPAIYLESNLSANSLMNYMRLMAEKYDLNGDDVQFYLK